MKQPWEVPDPPEKGDASNIDTFAAVGRALSQWEWLEGNLSLIFSYVVGTGFGNMAAARAYGSVMSFRSRADMLRHAAEVYFNQKPNEALHSALVELLNAASSKYSARRNEIAHGIVNPYIKVVANKSVQTGYVLYPAYYATGKRKLPEAGHPIMDTTPTYIYSSIEIDNFGKEFGGLAEAAIELLTSFARHEQIFAGGLVPVSE